MTYKAAINFLLSCAQRTKDPIQGNIAYWHFSTERPPHIGCHDVLYPEADMRNEKHVNLRA